MPTLKSMLRSTANRLLRPFDLALCRSSEPAQPAPSRWTMEGLLGRLQANGVRPASLIDLGAAEGKWTRLARGVFPDSRILMVEPLEERRHELERLTVEFPHMQLSRTAVGDTPGDVRFHVTDDLDGSGVYSDDHGHPARSVACETVDTLVQRHQLPGPYLIKFDTHGYELPILRGASATLKDTCAIIMEVYNFRISPTAVRFWDMCQELEALGFLCADLCDPFPRPGDQLLWQMDLLFLPEGHPCFQQQSYR